MERGGVNGLGGNTRGIPPAGTNHWEIPPPSIQSGKMINHSEAITATTSVVKVKIGGLKAVGKKLVSSQELCRFFRELEREGVGTRSVESKARKMVEEQCSKNPNRAGTRNKVGTSSSTNTNIVDKGEGNNEGVEKSRGVERDGKVVCELMGGEGSQEGIFYGMDKARRFSQEE